MLLTKEQIQEFIRSNGEMITISTAEKLTEFIHQASNSAYLKAPVLYEYPDGIWVEKMQYFDMNSDRQIPIEPLRKGRIMFVEDMPHKVPMHELVSKLEKSGDVELKEYARRLRSAGIEL